MTEWSLRTTSAEETLALGEALARALRPPAVVLLAGDLGAGKTTFAKGLISGLRAAQPDEVLSPTFTLVHVFRGRFPVYHVDLYRVGDFHDLETLGLEDAFSENAVVVVEWPERLRLRTDWPVVRLRIEQEEGDARRIWLEAPDGFLPASLDAGLSEEDEPQAQQDTTKEIR